MTDKKYSDPNGDPMACMLPEKLRQEEFKRFYDKSGIPEDLDNKTSTAIQQLVGGNFQEVDDIHNQLQKPTKLNPVISPIKNVGGQSSDAPTTITWPALYSDPVAEVGGIFKNVVMFNLRSEIDRNLAFAESCMESIADGEGYISSVTQFYAGYGAKIKFADLNFLLESKGQKSLTEEQLADKKTVEKYISAYLDTILPAPIHKIKIDMTAQTLEILHVQSPHSSIVLRFPMKDGSIGHLGIEVGRPSFTYVNGMLVQNAHEQAVDAAVFQSMNFKTIALPKTIEEFKKKNMGMTKDNFAKFNTAIPIEDLPDSSKPAVRAINLVNSSEKGDLPQGNKDSYLSDGTPCAITTHKVPNAKALAKAILILVGENPWDALRFGGYFAHEALTGQSRACEALVVYGCDLGGIEPSELLPILADLKQYDMSQEMRESVYENFLHIELSENLPEDKDSSIFSPNTAISYLNLVANSYECMQVYRDLLSASQQTVEEAKALKQTDSQAEDIYNRTEQQTRNFMHRYEHMWAIAAYIVINMYRTVFLYPVDENQTVQEAFQKDAGKKFSVYIEIARALTNEKIKVLEKKISAGTIKADSGKKSVQQNSLDLAKEAIVKLDAIEKELAQ